MQAISKIINSHQLKRKLSNQRLQNQCYFGQFQTLLVDDTEIGRQINFINGHFLTCLLLSVFSRESIRHRFALYHFIVVCVVYFKHAVSFSVHFYQMWQHTSRKHCNYRGTLRPRQIHISLACVCQKPHRKMQSFKWYKLRDVQLRAWLL